MGNVNNFKRMNEIKYTSNYQLSPDQRIKLYSLISIEKNIMNQKLAKKY